MLKQFFTEIHSFCQALSTILSAYKILIEKTVFCYQLSVIIIFYFLLIKQVKFSKRNKASLALLGGMSKYTVRWKEKFLAYTFCLFHKLFFLKLCSFLLLCYWFRNIEVVFCSPQSNLVSLICQSLMSLIFLCP